MIDDTTIRGPHWVAGWTLVSMVGFALGFVSGWQVVQAVTGNAAGGVVLGLIQMPVLHRFTGRS